MVARWVSYCWHASSSQIGTSRMGSSKFKKHVFVEDHISSGLSRRPCSGVAACIQPCSKLKLGCLRKQACVQAGSYIENLGKENGDRDRLFEEISSTTPVSCRSFHQQSKQPSQFFHQTKKLKLMAWIKIHRFTWCHPHGIQVTFGFLFPPGLSWPRGGEV